MSDEIFSIGIDIGTTTTQLIISKLVINNTSSSFVLPKLEITSTEIIYKSSIYITPLVDFNQINYAAVKTIIEQELVTSGIDKASIRSGAVIITGETVRKNNASYVLNSISSSIGEFVVSEAGPELEAILSACGAGCKELSKEKKSSIINFDIGGGTTNAAAYADGSLLYCFALDIGGRLIKFNEYNEISYISHRIQWLIKKLNLSLCVGEKASFHTLKKLTDKFAEMFLELYGLKPLTDDTIALLISKSLPDKKVQYISFSGGVAEFIYSAKPITTIEDVVIYNDIGPLLGFSIRTKLQQYALNVIEPVEKIRATVIGAGAHSIKLSGSTIFYNPDVLPMKNIPIINWLDGDNKIFDKVSYFNGNQIALAFKGSKSPSYKELQQIASTIIKVFNDVQGAIIVIIENDFAKALGFTINRIINKKKPVICIDRVSVTEGDYIDIGSPISGTIPVVVKTLIFS